jgi:hypothetical protein
MRLNTLNVWWHAANLYYSCCPHGFRSVEGLGCRSEILTRACLTASRRATVSEPRHTLNTSACSLNYFKTNGTLNTVCTRTLEGLKIFLEFLSASQENSHSPHSHYTLKEESTFNQNWQNSKSYDKFTGLDEFEFEGSKKLLTPLSFQVRKVYWRQRLMAGNFIELRENFSNRPYALRDDTKIMIHTLQWIISLPHSSPLPQTSYDALKILYL